MSGAGARGPKADLLSATFFAFRTPLLPFDAFLSWSDGLSGAAAAADDPSQLERALASDRSLLRGRLAKLVREPLIRDALFVSSPDLDDALPAWLEDPDSERGARVERALVRYFSRMAGRPTPFGLFAGTSVGSIGDRTDLTIGGRETYRRHSRFDMDYLSALTGALADDPALYGAFEYRPNSSLYRAAGRMHYVETRRSGEERTHHLVAVEDSDALRSVLERAAAGASFEALASALVSEDVDREEADGFVRELIESQVLRPELEPYLTGPDPSEALARQLIERPETARIGERLGNARRSLAALDREGLAVPPARYRAVARELEGLAAPARLSKLFQVDLIKPAPDATLGGAVLDEILQGVSVAIAFLEARGPDNDLSRFRDAFVERYGAREVPLTEALDEEAGIGFPPAPGDGGGGARLLDKLGLEAAGEAPSVSWSERTTYLLRRLNDALETGALEVVLDPKDVERLRPKETPALPDAFAVVATVVASDEALARGDFRVVWGGAEGPSGARLLGRFCHADAGLERCVEEHARAEERTDPDAVFAEVVHLPQGRIGNVLFRPVLRGHEIPYLGRSGISDDRKIPVSDLLLSVASGRVVLRSARLGRRVVPRLTSAHNFRRESLDLYHFLCELQDQDSPGPIGWNWGPLWRAPFLPRVVCGRLVLSLARWTAMREELEPIWKTSGTARFQAVQSWRTKRRLPRFVLLAEGDNRLPVDFENVLSVDSFAHRVRNGGEVEFVELFPGPDDLCARGPEGRFVHELVIPVIRTPAANEARPAEGPRPAPRAVPAAPAIRRFPPGSAWLYAKLYTGPASADGLLRDIVAPLVERAVASGAADRWFFIRYGDPHWHLRLRLRGEPSRLLGEVLPDLHASAAAPLADGRFWKIQLDTYEPEVERYGGAEAIDAAERIFQADSECALRILEMLEEGDAGADERWRIALRGADAMLEDFGLRLEEKRHVVTATRDELRKSHRFDDGVRRRLGVRFREVSRSLEALLEEAPQDISGEESGEAGFAPGLALLRERSDRIAPAVRDLQTLAREGRLGTSLPEVAASQVHMQMNRWLRADHRKQELVLYDFLVRLYDTRVMRAAHRRDR
jgi:thiopeptide-type bacteriocin biosynthesis protein